MTDNNDHTRTPNLVLSVLGAAIVLTIFVPATLYCTPLGRSWRGQPVRGGFKLIRDGDGNGDQSQGQSQN